MSDDPFISNTRIALIVGLTAVRTAIVVSLFAWVITGNWLGFLP